MHLRIQTTLPTASWSGTIHTPGLSDTQLRMQSVVQDGEGPWNKFFKLPSMLRSVGRIKPSDVCDASLFLMIPIIISILTKTR